MAYRLLGRNLLMSSLITHLNPPLKMEDFITTIFLNTLSN